mmetsp:Transcript_4376/g.7193  ORF Transcript_4376/g.7193 Transcript_4376/m.7193 type:complete len:148 (-) Transcript_4376:216-659(-)
MLLQSAIAFAGLLTGLLIARRPTRSPIVRLGVTEKGPFAHSAAHGGVVYLSGVTAQADGGSISESDSVAEQTRRVLAVIDDRLAAAGTDKSRLLSAQVWLKDISGDFQQMNIAWNEWVSTDKPVRATVEARLAKPAMLVEIQVTAAA